MVTSKPKIAAVDNQIKELDQFAIDFFQRMTVTDDEQTKRDVTVVWLNDESDFEEAIFPKDNDSPNVDFPVVSLSRVKIGIVGQNIQSSYHIHIYAEPSQIDSVLQEYLHRGVEVKHMWPKAFDRAKSIKYRGKTLHQWESVWEFTAKHNAQKTITQPQYSEHYM